MVFVTLGCPGGSALTSGPDRDCDERGVCAVPDPQDGSVSMDDFGPNEWLVDELYQQFTQDRNSVDKAWWESSRTTRRDRLAGAPTAARRRGIPPPRARPPPRPSPRRPSPRRPSPPSRSGQGRDEEGRDEESRAHPSRGAEAREGGGAGRRGRAHPPSWRCRPRRHQHGASLEVPVATSVRAIPAKLLIDNRIVINNHLGRSRGGKVSFTHLIGYALIKRCG